MAIDVCKLKKFDYEAQTLSYIAGGMYVCIIRVCMHNTAQLLARFLSVDFAAVVDLNTQYYDITLQDYDITRFPYSPPLLPHHYTRK